MADEQLHVALVHMRHASSGGVERYLNNIARELAQRGHRVTIVCRSHVEPPHRDVKFAVLRPPSLGGPHRMWRFAQAVERHVAEADYDVVFAIGRTWSHDVIRLGGGVHQTYVELREENWRPPMRWLKDTVRNRIEARAFAPGRYRRIITNSNMVKRDVIARFAVPPEAVSVIFNGVDVERFSRERNAAAAAGLRQECGFKAEDCVVLFLGTGFRRKGLERVLAAFPQVVQHRPDARLLVVGRDSRIDRYRARAAQAGLSQRVVFTGPRSDPEVCYAAADLYVLPTLYDPFANATIEALASGLPVITSSTNGGSELMEEGVHGSVLSPNAGADELSEAILRWADPVRRAAAREACRALAQEHRLESKMAASVELIEQVAREKCADGGS